MPEVKSVRDADVAGKRVLMRCDFDVPIENGEVVEDIRIKDMLPTLSLLHERGAAHIILVGHVGRPGGKVDERFRMAPVEAHLHKLTKIPFEILENLRFDAREEENNEAFAKELASRGDMFVNEAFANSHRAHASVVGVPKFLPSYIGLQFEQEIKHLSEALVPPPGSVALVAVTKSDKFPLVEKLATLYHNVLVGGPVLESYAPPVPNILLPQDGIPERHGLLDIGPKTRAAWVEEVAKAPFVLWNGPLGWYEKGYTESTHAIAETIISNGVRAVIGGGDTINALKQFQFDREKVFLSTGGGAMLEFLTAGTLPGIEALKR